MHHAPARPCSTVRSSAAPRRCSPARSRWRATGRLRSRTMLAQGWGASGAGHWCAVSRRRGWQYILGARLRRTREARDVVLSDIAAFETIEVARRRPDPMELQVKEVTVDGTASQEAAKGRRRSRGSAVFGGAAYLRQDSPRPWRPTPGCDTRADGVSAKRFRSPPPLPRTRPAFRSNTAQTARTCIYGHLEEHHVNDPAVSHLEMDDNVPGREHELGRPRHAMSVMSALAL